MRFLILGPLEARGEDGAVALSGNKLRGLLAVLLLHANEPVSAKRLALALWGEDAPDRTTNTVKVHVSRLRKALGDAARIETMPAGYCLRVRPDELDAALFDRLVEDGRRALAGGQPGHAGTILREALSLWRGPALAELAFEPFAAAEIARLEEQHLAALETRIEADLADGRHAELVAELRRLVAVNARRERLVAQLMLALYRCGRQADALAVYQNARGVLLAQAGLEPGPRLRELQEAILRQHIALGPGDGVPRGSPALDAASASPPLGREDEPVMLAFPRSLHAPAGSLFVGRDAELVRLHEHWTRVRGGAHSAVVIGGEPGIGKTRLASELARAVYQEGALVLYGRCDEGLVVPYQPFVEALRPYARRVGLDRLRAELGDLTPELARLLPELAGLGEPIRGDPESERFALFEAVAALIEAMTHERRALLVLDDLQWAANPTLLLLRHLLRSERLRDVLVLCTYRQTELDLGQPLAQLLAELRRDAGAECLSIRGLDEPAIAALVEAAVGHPLQERAELVHVLGAQTAGNPFFLRELLAHWTESGTISLAGERSRAGVTAAQRETPNGLRQVISHRVARLSAPAGRALRVAAVAGPTFSFVLLERMLGERSGVLDALDEAVAAGLLAEAGHGDYVFAHALVRQTIYAQLGAARRIRLHRQLGEALEALADTDAHVEALAHHFAEAAADGQGDKAAAYALAAGRSAIARLGYEEAIAHYERGLEALTVAGQPHEHRRCELLLALGEARWGAGGLDKARQACAQAAKLADQLGDATALARAALGFCGPHRVEAAPAAIRAITILLQRALAALGEDDSALRARLMGRLAGYSDVEQRRSVLGRQALEMARRIADRATLADVLASGQWATQGPDALHESLALAAELGGVAEEIGDSRLRAVAHEWLLPRLLELGDIDAVERELDALQRLTETRTERYFNWVLGVIRASHALLQGRIEDCETLAHDARARSFEGHDETAARIFAAQMLFVRSAQGRFDELVESVKSFTAQVPQVAVWRCALAIIYAQLGHSAQARHELEALARDDFADLPRDMFWLVNMSTLSEVVALLGDARRAQLLYTPLLPYADRCLATGALLCQGSASRPLGLLATTLSLFEDATLHFEQALKMNAQIRSPLWIAHTQHDYARMLLARNHPGDNEKALELLRQALTTAEQLGLTALADKARSLKLTTEATAPLRLGQAAVLQRYGRHRSA
ncbi:MAG: ATP-binding protein [Solirubrobacteraceae bacterium]